MEIDDKVIGDLIKGYKGPEDLIGQNGLLKQLTKRLVEAAMNAELTSQLGYGKHERAPEAGGNARNGSTPKKLKGDFGEIEIETPRDRKGEFEPQIVRKHQRRFDGFDNKILSMYARGLSTREIEGHLKEIYGVDVSPSLISEVTDGVLEDVRTWQNRPLDPLYPVVFLDALYVKMRHEGRVENRAVYVAIGVNLDGMKEVLGLWTSGSEGAKFWLSVLTDLRSRGVKDIFVACVDGLKGFPQAIETLYPQAQVQLCIVHMVRASLNYVTWRDRKEVVADLKPIYRAVNAAQASQELEEFAGKWTRYPAVAKLWRENWERVIPFFAFPPEVRKVVYTTNAVESLHMSLRKVIKTRGSFPSEEAALKLLYLAVRNASAKWKAVQGWREAMNCFETLWGDRIRAALQRS